jgi:uncharacterized protein YodC (DUF2158 family)
MDAKCECLILFFFFCFLMSCPPLPVFAADKVVVIPLFGHGKPLKNVVTVAKSGGKFTDPVAAVSSITDASENNPYLVVIAPGIYTLTQTLVMKPWVDITGSGENVTKLTGAISSGRVEESAIVRGWSEAMLSDLTIVNVGGGHHSIAVYAYGSYIGDVKLQRITAIASGGSVNTGIRNEFSMPNMLQVTAKASGGSISYGVFNGQSGSPTMTQVTAEASDGTFNCAIYNHYGCPFLTQVTANAQGGDYSFGIYNNSASIFKFLRVSAKGLCGMSGKGYGLYNINSEMSVKRSTLLGSTRGLKVNDNKPVNVSQSTIIGGVNNSTVIKCVACDDGNGNALDNSCQ